MVPTPGEGSLEDLETGMTVMGMKTGRLGTAGYDEDFDVSQKKKACS